MPRPTRLDFDQSSDGQSSVVEELPALQEKRPLSVPTPPERSDRRYAKNNEHHHHHDEGGADYHDGVHGYDD